MCVVQNVCEVWSNNTRADAGQKKQRPGTEEAEQ